MYPEKSIKWYNGGISASDPFANFYNLQNELYKLKPDLVVQIFTSQDFEEDFLFRGGYKRFKNNQLEYSKVPFFENIYAYSHIVRMFRNNLTGVNYYISRKSLKQYSTSSLFNKLVKLYDKWAQKNQTPVVLVFYHTGSFYYFKEQKVIMDQSSKSISDYLKIESLTSCYQKSIHNDFDSFKSLWWVKDSHHNARGYHLMANCIYESIQPIVDSNYIKKFHK